MTESLLFSTSASPSLSQTVLGQVIGLRPAQYRLGSFIDGEVMFYLDEPVKGRQCFVIGHSGPPGENLLQLFTIINTLKINGAKPIIVIIPYLGYSRSDRDKPLQPVNSRLFSSFLKQSGVSKIICLDLHSLQNAKYFSVPHIQLSALPLMAEIIKTLRLPRLSVASPDLGGGTRASAFAQYLGLDSYIHIEKYRPSVSTAEVLKISGDVNNRNIVLVDDMIQTGHTLVSAAKALKAKGARDLYAAVTHSVPQANGIKLITSTSLFKKIFITNSLSQDINLPTRVSVIDISPLLAAAITKEL